MASISTCHAQASLDLSNPRSKPPIPANREPKFILLDEPFAGIDPIAVADLQRIVLKLKEKGLGVLITDHSVRETLTVTDRAYIIHEGVVMVSGTSEFLVNDKKARQLYLGENFYMQEGRERR